MNTSSDHPNPAALGDLAPARERMAAGDLHTAWNHCLAAVQARPCHPEAFLLGAQIAAAAKDPATAQLCAARARAIAPGLAGSQSLNLPASVDGKTVDWPGLDELTTPPARPRLSVCMIVKNEEAFLGSCLKSVREIAAQIIVVDTGSTDRTIAIAREQGAEVFEFPWTDDFSAARNAGLIHARGDWILVLDADEELTPGAAKTLLQEMSDSTVIAYDLPLTNEGREAEGSVYLPRLFRNVPGVSYQGRVHEQIMGGVLSRTAGWGLKPGVSNAVLLHHGYTREVTAARNKPLRNLRLLEKALETAPDDPITRAYLLMNLGLETVRTGDLPGGIGHYEKALELLNHVIQSGKPGLSISPEFRASFLHQYAPYLNRAGRSQNVIRLFETPLARNGDLSASDHYMLGLALGQAAQFEAAAREFQSCIAKRNAPTRVPNHAVVMGHAPFQCLANAQIQLQRHAEAEKTYLLGLTQLPQSQELQLEYARFKFRLGQPLEALKSTHAIVNAHPENTAAWILGAEICLSQAQFSEVASDWTAAALHAHPADSALIALRCETLLLTGDTPAALKLADQLLPSASTLAPRALAAILFCQMLANTSLTPVSSQIEPTTSQAFLDLYRRIGMARGTSMVQSIKAKLNRLSTALPLAHKALSQLAKSP